MKWPVLASCLTLSAVVIMVFLGSWQLDRMEQKQHRLDSIAQKYTTAPMHPFDVAEQWQDVRDVPVKFRGELNADQPILLDNQITAGATGYDVLVPVITRGRPVLVNIGWVAAPASRAELPVIELPAGQVEIEGVITQPGMNPLIQETQQHFDDFPLLVQQIDIPLFNQQWASQLPDMVIERLASQPQMNQFATNWQPVVMSPQKHLGYAIQWFGLAIAAVVIFIIVLIRRTK
jgi:cytochrome oxidase assembly protein ShyY1